MSGASSPAILPTLGFALVRDTLIYCSRADEASHEDWDRWLGRLAASDFSKLLIFAAHSPPNAKQRASVAAFWKKSGRATPITAIVSDSVVTRASVTVFQWLLQDTSARSFRARELGEALAWLGTSASVADVTSLLLRLKPEETTSHKGL